MKSVVKAAVVNSPGEKICSRCHAVFTCGPEQGAEKCWCERLPHVPIIADERTDCFCSECLSEAIAKLNAPESRPTEVVNEQCSLPLLREGEDYYVEGGAMVFTAAYHLKRGYCCDSGCRHCPYDQQPIAATQRSELDRAREP
jgi:hypothetical protein